MKTIEQTSRYLRLCLFGDEDWDRVLSFCRETFGGGNIHKPKYGVYYTDYASFITWFNHLPGQGDIVKYGSILGIVGLCTPSDYTLSAYTGLNGELIVKDMIVSPYKIHQANDNDRIQFLKIMAERKLSYSIKLDKLVEAYIPEDGEFVILKRNGKRFVSIFEKRNGMDYVFYYISKSGKIMRYGDSVPVSECEFERSTTYDNLNLLSELTSIGFAWNAARKTFYEVPQQASYGGKYWFINDKFHICQAKDLKTPVHKERYDNGNYFTNYSEALLFAREIKKLRMNINKGYDL